MIGVGMQCNDPGSIFYVSMLSILSGVQGSCVEIGFGASDSWTMPLDQQVEIACAKVRGMPQLQQGYNLVGLSQGNIIGRGMIELCDNLPPVGPRCGALSYLYKMGVYSGLVQDIPGYLEGCKFLPKINNEIPSSNNTLHKQRFSSLQNLVLIMFESDSVVIPALSSWFGFYQDGDSTTVLPPQQTRLYKEDLFGLKTLDEAGKVKFIRVGGAHLEITIPEMQQYVVPYLIG
ncbi:hypothetical protein DM860_000747 [Cuscuta australis]|uniref:Palmitoyl-protein thioesterase 1 n=1 Tax=Cuscuta australis TaxID=267555 RepID=A0A328D2F5_9ASTE|nr:hypothetical protein DM860_000747 [Cuscuta australis]